MSNEIESTQERATTRNLSLYPKHLVIIKQVASNLGIANRKRNFSPAIQHVLEWWAEKHELKF